MYKKFICLATMLVAIAVFFACGLGDSSSAQSGSSSSQTESISESASVDSGSTGDSSDNDSSSGDSLDSTSGDSSSDSSNSSSGDSSSDSSNSSSGDSSSDSSNSSSGDSSSDSSNSSSSDSSSDSSNSTSGDSSSDSSNSSSGDSSSDSSNSSSGDSSGAGDEPILPQIQTISYVGVRADTGAIIEIPEELKQVGGEYPTEYTIGVGATIDEMQSVPVLVGEMEYVFVGYYANAECTESFDGVDVFSNEAITVYVKIEVYRHTPIIER